MLYQWINQINANAPEFYTTERAISAWVIDRRQSIFDLLQSWQRSHSNAREKKGRIPDEMRTLIRSNSIWFSLCLACCCSVGLSAFVRRFFQVIKIIYRLSLDASFRLIGFHHFSFPSVDFSLKPSCCIQFHSWAPIWFLLHFSHRIELTESDAGVFLFKLFFLPLC